MKKLLLVLLATPLLAFAQKTPQGVTYDAQIIRVNDGDTVVISNNSVRTVSNVDYQNNVVYLTSNLSAYANSGSLMTVNRTFVTSNVYDFGAVGVQYFPVITTENGNIIITENGLEILLG